MKVSFDCVADIYDISRELPHLTMERVVGVLVDELQNYRTILDCGVGTGRYAKPLQENGFEVVGIDISRKMLKKAKEKGVSNLFLSDACALPFKNSSFHVSISTSVLHLIQDWKTALNEITRVTTHLLVSIVRSHPNPVSEAYNNLLKEHGFTIPKFGIGEWELKNLFKPIKSIFAASYEVNADKSLAFLRDKAFSYQWQVPDNLNRQAVKKLEKNFAGKTYKREIEVLIWDINKFKIRLKAT